MPEASDVLVTPAFVRTMAAYNAEMNRRIYAAAERIPEGARRLDRGAFWGSLHGTLCHLLWGDLVIVLKLDFLARRHRRHRRHAHQPVFSVPSVLRPQAASARSGAAQQYGERIDIAEVHQAVAVGLY